MKRKPVICSLLLLLSFFCIPVHGQQLQAALSHYSADDGLASNAIADIKRDDYGYIWLSTWNGLSRFDGYNFYNYETGNRSGIPLLHNRIAKIVIDQGQNVWMVMYDKRIFVLNRKTDKIINPLEGITGYEDFKTSTPLFVTSSGYVLACIDGVGIYSMQISQDNKVKNSLIATGGLKVNAIVEGHKGDLWAGCDNGIHRLSLTNGVLEKKGVFEGEDINCIYSNGYDIYAGTVSGKLVTFSPGQQPRIISELPLPITSVYVDKHNLLWFSTTEWGVSRLNLETGNVKSFEQRVLVPVYDSRGSTVMEADSILWVAMNHGGFGYYNRQNDEIEYFHNDPSNSWNLSNSINAYIALDEGVIWESTSRRGLEKLEILKTNIERRRLFDNVLNGSMANEIRALYYDQKRNQLLIGNKTGTLSIFRNGVRTDYQSDETAGRSMGRIYGINMDRDGNYWLCCKGTGVIRLTPAGNSFDYTFFTKDGQKGSSLNSNDAYCSVQDKAGNIWVATYGGGVNILIRQKDGSYKILNKDNGLNKYPRDGYQKIRTLALDHDGNVWAGTTDGLLIMSLQGQKFVAQEVVSSKNTRYVLGSNDIVCLACARDGSMWIGTNGGGLCHVVGREDDGSWKFEDFNVHDGLPSEEILSMTFDSQDHVWFCTDHVLCSFDTERRIFSTFSMQDGVDETMCSEGAALVLPNGNVLFGTIDGYYVVDRKKLVTASGSLLKLRITDFYLNDAIVSPHLDDFYDYYVPDSEKVELPSHGSMFTIRFAALNYQLQHRTHYQYMLEGYDDDWQNADKSRAVSYSGLPAGTYRFKVKAFLLESPENYDLRTLTVIVPPYLLLSPTAVWIYMVLAVCIILGIIFWLQERKKHKERHRVLKVGQDNVAFEHKDDYDFMKRQLDWLEEHYSDTGMRYEDMIAQSALGRTAYYKQLESFTGMSPRDFVTDFRLKKAIQLLEKDNGLSINEIATKTGFNDPIFFTRSFKNKTGLTPLRYRTKKMEEKDN